MNSTEREIVRIGWENLNNGWWKKGNRLMSFDEAVALELRSAQQNEHLTGLHCPACMCRNEEIVTCARCGTVKSAPQVA